jgi:formylglycine-generating enzyme required for sulfatase activity
MANFGNNVKRPCKVGSYPPNAFGLYDMHGNVREWCEDGTRAYENKEISNPSVLVGAERAVRGGAWLGPALFCRSAKRSSTPLTYRDGRLGFRIALSAE